MDTMPVLNYPHIVYVVEFYYPMLENGIHCGNERRFSASFNCASFRQRGVCSWTVLTEGCTLLDLSKYFYKSSDSIYVRTCDVVNYEEDIDQANRVEEKECVAQDLYIQIIGSKTGRRKVIYNEVEKCDFNTDMTVSLDIDFAALEFQFLKKPTPSKFRSF